MRELACFAGAGGGILASTLLGWSTLAAIEIEQYPRDVLIQRQRDGCLSAFPVYRDIREFDGRPWRGIIDVVSGGFPCQDISQANRAPKGIAGARSGLWSEMCRVIGEVRPAYVFAENSPNLRTRGLGTIIKELASLGYDTRWCVLGAWHTGCPHRRNRMWVYACHANSKSQPVGTIDAQVAKLPRMVADTNQEGPQRQPRHGGATQRRQEQAGYVAPCGVPPRAGPDWWEAQSGICRVTDDVANRVGRLRAIGNGQVPSVAALAWHILHGAGQ